MSNTRRAFNKLYKRGYVDFVLGNGDVSIASPFNRKDDGFGSNNMNVGEFSCGMKWCNVTKKYKPSAKLSTSILCK